MKKNVLIIIFSLLVLQLSGQTYSGGSGTENDPYLISSKADMETLAVTVNGITYAGGGKNYSGVYFLLTCNITDITTIIGNRSFGFSYFSGIFNGGGHKITANINSNNNYVLGLFGYLKNATIKNLGISGTITGTASNVGGICGIAENLTVISNCYNEANISSTCTFTNLDSAPLNVRVGGICGGSGTSVSDNVTITDCYNTGNISSIGTTIYSTVYPNGIAGGICGMVSGYSMNRCYNVGNITARGKRPIYDTYYRVSGILGTNGGNGTVNNCFAAKCEIKTDGEILQSYYAARIAGNYYTPGTKNYADNSSVLLNGSSAGSTYALAEKQDGANTTLGNLQSQSWITTNLSWDFGTVWIMPNNSQFPVLRVHHPELGTSVEEIRINTEKKSIAYYSLVGVKLKTEPQNGIYIILYDDGSSKKVHK